MSKTSDRLKDYQNQMSIYAEQHKIILASDVLDMIEQLQDDLKDDIENVVAELEKIKQYWKMKEQERGLNFMDCVILREYQKHYDKAINIVRKGGVE